MGEDSKNVEWDPKAFVEDAVRRMGITVDRLAERIRYKSLRWAMSGEIPFPDAKRQHIQDLVKLAAVYGPSLGDDLPKTETSAITVQEPEAAWGYKVTLREKDHPPRTKMIPPEGHDDIIDELIEHLRELKAISSPAPRKVLLARIDELIEQLKALEKSSYIARQKDIPVGAAAGDVHQQQRGGRKNVMVGGDFTQTKDEPST